MRFYSFATVLGALVLGGCSTASTAGKPVGANPNLSTSRVQLAKGMTAAQVTALLGEPQKKAVKKTASGEVEIWTYLRKLDERLPGGVNGATMGTTYSIPTRNPSGGGGMTSVTTGPQIQYGSLQMTRAVTEETTLIMFIGGQVQIWDRTFLAKGSQ
jgi:hypothetical protein